MKKLYSGFRVLALVSVGWILSQTISFSPSQKVVPTLPTSDKELSLQIEALRSQLSEHNTLLQKQNLEIKQQKSSIEHQQSDLDKQKDSISNQYKELSKQKELLEREIEDLRIHQAAIPAKKDFDSKPVGSLNRGCDNNCNHRGVCVDQSKCICEPGFKGISCTEQWNYNITLNQRSLLDKKQFPFGDTFLYGSTEFPEFNIENLNNGEAKEFMESIPKNDWKPKKYSTCAVVGAAKRLLKTEHGKAIDEHEMVMRINNSPTKGFEKFVGSKTTFDQWSHLPVIEITKSLSRWNFPDSAVLFHIRAPHWVEHFLKFHRAHPEKDFIIMDSDFLKPAYDLWNQWNDNNKIRFPTTGFLGVIWAFGVCERISMYGFFSPDDKDDVGHYYGGSHVHQKLTSHNYTLEHWIVDQLSSYSNRIHNIM